MNPHYRVTFRILATTFLLFSWMLSPVVHADTPLPQDGRILTGRLDNGVTWYYREHNNPPGKMAAKIHVRTGSLNETEGQRGLAHFMEHMAFNGTTHFPPGKLIPYFESIGMQFGAHLNAFTSFDQTVYMLFTPNTKTEQIDKALMVLSDYAFGASLLDEEITKERGIVLEESRRGKSSGQRIRDKLWPELFNGSRFAKRLPIGDDGIIANAPRAEFEQYYRQWYRPENVSVFLVGDSKPDEILPLIKKWFGDYKSSVPALKPHTAEFTPFTQERAMVTTDAEEAVCQIQMLNIRAAEPPTTTVEGLREDLIHSVAAWIISRRFDDRVKKGEASYRQASAGIQDFFHDGLLVGGFASGEAKDWRKMLKELITEINRIRNFGITDHELTLARTEILAATERAVRTEPTRSAGEIIDEIINDVNERTPSLSAQQSLDLHKQLLPGLKAEEINVDIQKYFAPGTFAYAISMSSKDPTIVPTREQVLAAAKEASAEKLVNLKQTAAITNLLAKLPKAGKVVEQSTFEPLGITSGWLNNGVRFHHRYMDYKKDSVLVSISLAGGTIEETAGNAGITDVATIAINEAATRKIPSSVMRDLMTGRNISVEASDMKDHFEIDVTGSPLDLEFGLQKSFLLLKEGIIEKSAFNNWRLSTLQSIEHREKLPQFKAQEAMESLLSGGDPRRAFTNRRQVEAMTLESAQSWFDRLCKSSPIEVAVVGDISLEKVLPLLERYLGSLPKRSRTNPAIDRLRQSPRPIGPLLTNVVVQTVTPQAVAIAGFAGSDGSNIRDSRALDLAALTLSSRLVKQVREELSIVYSIGARSTPAWIYHDAGRMSAGAPCSPANALRVNSEVHKIFRVFAENGPTEEELANAKKQMANNLDTTTREPSYWWGILRNHDLRHRKLDAEINIKEDFQTFSTAEIRTIFKKYYTTERRFDVTAIPKS